MFLGNEEADVVIMNGVFGWRDDGSHVDETKKVMQAVYKVMKTDGILILGRNYRHYEGFAFTNIIGVSCDVCQYTRATGFLSR